MTKKKIGMRKVGEWSIDEKDAQKFNIIMGMGMMGIKDFDSDKWVENLEQFLALYKKETTEFKMQHIIHDVANMMRFNQFGPKCKFSPRINDFVDEAKNK